MAYSDEKWSYIYENQQERNMFSIKLRMELKAVELKNIELSDEIIELKELMKEDQKRADFSSAESARRIEAATAVRKELSKTKKIVRAQTEADLLINALKAIGIIPKQEKEPDSFVEEARLQQRLAQYDGRNSALNAQRSGRALGGIFGGLG